MNINFSGMILAAGFGRRLMPLTKNLPKPLLCVNGITLLDNSINFLKRLGCKQIIINSHYKHEKIKAALNYRKDKENISLIYENKILDTGGGVKNAVSHFKNKDLIIINSDIFWQDNNIVDVQFLLNQYQDYRIPHMLLVKKDKAKGLNKKYGDFIIDNKKILRFKKGNQILFYSGLQILNLDIFHSFSEKKFSFNLVWDHLIKIERLYGTIMQTNLYHVGDINGLNIVKKLNS